MVKTQAELRAILYRVLQDGENECVEFKQANDNFSTSEIGKYFSALSNEANLRVAISAWLVFGVHDETRAIVGTTYRPEHERLHSIKQQIADSTDPSTSFVEVYELVVDGLRVVMFEIPPAPRGIPIGWQTHYYARNGESLTGLSVTKLDEIRSQSIVEDWSAVICEKATMTDLDPEALKRARDVYAVKYSDRIAPDTIQSWSDEVFLNKVRLTLDGRITRACLLLLGNAESVRHFSPFVAQISWNLEGPERAYEHFSPPFLLATTALYQRIRHIRITLLPPGQMIPVELSKYDQRIVLEALHNCVAHQDYSRQERILVTEYPTELVFQNAGGFFDGKPNDYIRENRTPVKYRNRLLTEAMVHLRMIDTMGFGIREIMWKGQARRYFPLPDYDLSDPAHVVLRLQGRIIDENYSRMLLAHADLPWPEVLALDSIQKGILPDEAILKSLRRKGFIEGRKPNLHVAADVASSTETEAEYLHHKAFDDEYYCDLIVKYLKKFGSAKRQKFNRLLEGKLSDLLTPDQKRMKIHNLLQKLQREGKIKVDGSTKAAVWRLAEEETH
ncbi:MAG: putative DNA binding domain-containing protein [Bacteroidetes bacterium]|nr:putative DNA binding domain-containing protein [Bacteroidota bacterium]